jgi:hypothetical protein
MYTKNTKKNRSKYTVEVAYNVLNTPNTPQDKQTKTSNGRAVRSIHTAVGTRKM